MKRTVLISVILLVLSGSSFLTAQTQQKVLNTDYLVKILEKLKTIKSASYISTGSASAPGDTLSFSEPRRYFYQEYVNPADTHTGASNASFDPGDTTRMLEFYDGTVRGTINWEARTIKIDSFQDHPYPFRLVYFPFFTKTASIIDYALKTKDRKTINLRDYGDSVLFSLLIYDQVVEFVTRPFIDPNPFESSVGKISQYDIWINKSTSLPYRMRRKMNHNTSFEAVTDVRLNPYNRQNLVASDFFPPDFKIVQFKREKSKPQSGMVGKKAPDWTLNDIDNKAIKFSDLKSKVIMIQFTGIGCGPCHQSIPFLKKMVNDYKNKNFEFICIETWSKKSDLIKRYYDNNGLNYKFLKSENQVTLDYDISAVPVFLIIDKDRIIRKVISGYSKGVTDTEILKMIDGLL